MRVRIDSLGCRLNIGEADHIARQLAGCGHRVVGPGERVDMLIFNSCAVTHVAARKSRKLIRHWRRTHPQATLVVTGCYSELEPLQVDELGVDLIVGIQDKDRLPGVLEEAGLLSDAETIPGTDGSPLDAACFSNRTRAFVKVQDGCDNRCTFCIVTVARGDSRSRPIADVVEEIRQLGDLGYVEVVLSGVHLGSYGHDRQSMRGLEELVAAVLEQTDIPRLRLSSLEPWDLRPEFFEVWGTSPRLLTHLHLPLQSGSDATLQRMARRTDQASFARLVEEARRAIPELAVTTDVIVGFPGETAAEFEHSIAFVERLQFAGLHVFRYSPRAGTAAATMPDQVAPATAQERSRAMHALGSDMESHFRRRYVGTSHSVLWETAEPREGLVRWSGLTGNYLRVVTDTPEDVDLENRVTQTTLCADTPGAMLGLTEGSIEVGAVRAWQRSRTSSAPPSDPGPGAWQARPSC